MNFKLTYENVVTFVKDWFGLIGVIIVGVSSLGFSLSPPWATAGEIDALRQEQRELRQGLKNTTCLALRVLLNDAQNDLERAEHELEEAPTSTAAQRAKRLAEDQIEEIEAQLRDAKCSAVR